jgi:hypothetical protein
MKKLLFVIIPIMFIMLACSVSLPVNISMNSVVGNGKMITQERPVSNFNVIRLAGSGNVEVTVGDKESLTIEAEDNILPLLTSYVSNGTLILGVKPGVSINPTREVRYVVTVKSVQSLELFGSGSMHLLSVNTNQMNLEVTGSGNITVDDLRASSLNAGISGSGNVTVKGSADSLKVTLPGSGAFIGGDLKSGDANVRIAGSGEVTLWSTTKLDVGITGSGHVNYYGSPALTERITGSGDVSRQGDK